MAGFDNRENLLAWALKRQARTRFPDPWNFAARAVFEAYLNRQRLAARRFLAELTPAVREGRDRMQVRRVGNVFHLIGGRRPT